MAWEDNPGDLHLTNPYLVKVHKAYLMFLHACCYDLDYPKLGWLNGRLLRQKKEGHLQGARVP